VHFDALHVQRSSCATESSYLVRQASCSRKAASHLITLVRGRMKRIAGHCSVRRTNHRFVVGMPPAFSPGDQPIEKQTWRSPEQNT
jgi:hypothetical protein